MSLGRPCHSGSIYSSETSTLTACLSNTIQDVVDSEEILLSKLSLKIGEIPCTKLGVDMAKKVKQTMKVVKRRDGRFAVVENGKYINGDAKVKVLVEKGLIKAPAAKKEEPAES